MLFFQDRSMMAWRQIGILALSFCICGAAYGGGGGENMLLVVNPNDPASLQIANAYATLRDIPANNILFLAPPSYYQNDGNPIAQSDVYTSGGTNSFLSQ